MRCPGAKIACVMAAAFSAAIAQPATAQIMSGYDPTKAPAAAATEDMTRGLETEQKIGGLLPMELRFTSAEGKETRLGDLFDLGPGAPKFSGKHRPVLIALVYYDCPVVCSATMDKIAGAIRRLDYKLGRDYKVAFFSFDSSETARRAMEVKEKYIVGNPDGLTSDGKFNPEIADNWNFFVGSGGAVRELANSLGFKFRAAANGQFAHSAVFMIITPEGRIARYFSPFLGDDKKLAEQVKLALLEASDGKVAKGVSDVLMNWCFMYDPKAGAYTLQAMRVMQIGAVLSTAAVGSMVAFLVLLERGRRKRLAARAAEANGPDPLPGPSLQGIHPA